MNVAHCIASAPPPESRTIVTESSERNSSRRIFKRILLPSTSTYSSLLSCAKEVEPKPAQTLVRSKLVFKIEVVANAIFIVVPIYVDSGRPKFVRRSRVAKAMPFGQSGGKSLYLWAFA